MANRLGNVELESVNIDRRPPLRMLPPNKLSISRRNTLHELLSERVADAFPYREEQGT